MEFLFNTVEDSISSEIGKQPHRIITLARSICIIVDASTVNTYVYKRNLKYYGGCT